MSCHPSILVATLALLGGCASFNDTVVIDIGDQFRLLEADGTQSRRLLEGGGFECRFQATVTRDSLFANERSVDGTVRCLPVQPAAD